MYNLSDPFIKFLRVQVRGGSDWLNLKDPHSESVVTRSRLLVVR